MGLLAYQPFKSFYLLGAFGFELARLPLWLFKYLTVYGRQHPEWTFKNALGNRFFYSFVYHLSIIQGGTKISLSPGREKDRFVLIKPAADSYYTGPFAPTKDVKPAEIGASWFPTPLTTSTDNKNTTVILHAHGGAYVIGDGRTDTIGYAAHQLVKQGAATHVLSPQYRLSTLPASSTSNPFPAALQDVLSTYLHLINDLGVPPKNVIFSGDSAGANAAIAVLRYITDFGAQLNIPSPGAAFLWSPWIQISESLTEPVAKNPNFGSDYISQDFIVWGAKAYAGPAGPKILDSEYISFKGRPFRTDVPLWVHTGGAEVLYFDDVKFAEEMKGVEGNKVVLDVEGKLPHDIILTAKAFGFEKELEGAAKRAGEFYREVVRK